MLHSPPEKVLAFGTVSSTTTGARLDLTAQCDAKRGDAVVLAVALDSRDAAAFRLEAPSGPVRCARR